MAAKRPYWIGDAKTEHGVYLGFTRGQWPIQAFTADPDDSMALRWVAESPDTRVLIGPIGIPDNVPTLIATRIPERFELIPLDD